MENFASSVFTMLLALAFVLALAWFSIRLLRRLQLGRASPQQGEALRFVRALPVGPRERVVVVQYRGEEWVLGVTAGGISLLGRAPAAGSAETREASHI